LYYSRIQKCDKKFKIAIKSFIKGKMTHLIAICEKIDCNAMKRQNAINEEF
jgi:hypothetical protein